MMTSSYTGPDTDDGTRQPQPAGDRGEPGDTRQLAPEPEDDEDDEAGYGYGV